MPSTSVWPRFTSFLLGRRIGYDPQTDIPDLTGKVALVTGGNTGIGWQTVAALARKGAKVYMGARNEGRAKAALERLAMEGALNGPGTVEWLMLDLSTPTSARTAGEEFLSKETRLDILVHNAATLYNPEFLQPVPGAKIPVSIIMAANHLGHFVLTTTLLPVLEETAAEPGSDVRVITLTSIAHKDPPPWDVGWKSADNWVFTSGDWVHNLRAYGTTKLANILFSKELQRRFDEKGLPLTSMSVHPGAIATDGALGGMRWSWLGGWLVAPLFWAFSASEPKGAYNTLFAATSSVVRERGSEFKGAYLKPVGVIAQPSLAALDPVAARDLWETSEKVAIEM